MKSISKKSFRQLSLFLLLIVMVFILASCGVESRFVILSGSENKTLEPLLQDFGRQKNIAIKMEYKGSLDIMHSLQQNPEYDAIWPANSIWISMGDTDHLVKHLKSIMTSPVVFGIKKSLAGKLGFVNRKVMVKDILDAIVHKKLTFMMTSATQSNSGASAYFGFLYALLNNPQTITSGDLQKPALKEQIRMLFSGINRSSGSSDWLKDLFLSGNYDAMVNYESLIIETNQELIRRHQEPLYAVYPYDGIAIADSPLGYINHRDSDKEKIFLELQNYLLSAAVQKKILQLGRRTGFGGMVDNADSNVFNPDWGIDSKRILSPIKFPAANIIREALNLYQTELKKPSYTVFCLDFSGSMAGKGESELKKALELILNQDRAKQNLLQATSRDITTVIAFNDEIVGQWKVTGNHNEDFHALLEEISDLSPDNGTDIYSPVIAGLREIQAVHSSDYIPAVILMTDGQSNTGLRFEDFKKAWLDLKLDIPVFAITFGDASESQLDRIAQLTRGRIFDGKKDLLGAFKTVRGYN